MTPTVKKQHFEFHIQVQVKCDSSQQAFTTYRKACQVLKEVFQGAPYEIGFAVTPVLTLVEVPSHLVLVEGGSSGKDS